MTIYKKLYFTLFNRITDVIEGLEKVRMTEDMSVALINAKESLKKAQIDAEEMYISCEEDDEED